MEPLNLQLNGDCIYRGLQRGGGTGNITNKHVPLLYAGPSYEVLESNQCQMLMLLHRENAFRAVRRTQRKGSEGGGGGSILTTYRMQSLP